MKVARLFVDRRARLDRRRLGARIERQSLEDIDAVCTRRYMPVARSNGARVRWRRARSSSHAHAIARRTAVPPRHRVRFFGAPRERPYPLPRRLRDAFLTCRDARRANRRHTLRARVLDAGWVSRRRGPGSSGGLEDGASRSVGIRGRRSGGSRRSPAGRTNCASSIRARGLAEDPVIWRCSTGP